MAKYIKNTAKSVQKVRFLIQLIFALLCIWIGIEFHLFVRALDLGTGGSHLYRPPGVEGFLPISALMSLYYFILTGVVHPVHPAGLFIFVAILAISLMFGKSFCGWLCPVGFISELVGDFSEKLFKRKMRLPRWLDYLLRPLKYLLLLFFAASIFAMSAASLSAFLGSPYNIFADVKMYWFFADISRFSVIVLSSLFLLSLVVRNFWCRYLCPYGALLGVASLLSPNKITRNAPSCIDCGLCAKACPSAIKVDKVRIVLSDECTSCLLCVDACPVAETLYVKPVMVNKRWNTKTVAAVIVLLFVGITGVAMLTGNWQNNITTREYRSLNAVKNDIDHFTGGEGNPAKEQR